MSCCAAAATAAEKAAKDVSTFLNATAKEEEERSPLPAAPPLPSLYLAPPRVALVGGKENSNPRGMVFVVQS